MEDSLVNGTGAGQPQFQYPTLGSFLWKLRRQRLPPPVTMLFQYPTLGSFLWKLFGWLGLHNGLLGVSVSYPRIVPMEALTSRIQRRFL